MAPEREDFSVSGPLHLIAIDWKNVHHRRSVAASLVQGVYVLERDRQKKREGPKALASPWWEFFDFQMVGQLIDDDDSSIFGAIYKFKPPPSQRNLSTDGCPRYVIAFRADLICSEYVGYFKHKKMMVEFGVGCIERLATQLSLRGLFTGKESEPMHRIPSANLTVNLTPSWGFKQAHGINQWWRPDLYMESVRY
ncbi:hypothetical protein Dsin_007938 [Dipteronia sinensis]|uniref:Uncharacterized protein n=1 Tax=Dipteronia sinensis TaxID=43782 RepID=A0AAE0B1M4_9ROSI|nr:hypothetical protein Dsin_007938 [Dipteronia sinensis]